MPPPQTAGSHATPSSSVSPAGTPLTVSLLWTSFWNPDSSPPPPRRIHGHVARGDWDTWQVEVAGLVRYPRTFSMKDLLSMPALELPVTFACSGNRRKDMNMVKRTKSFNLGPAAIATNLWKGARLRDVPKHCGILLARQGSQFVGFESGEMLPAGASHTPCGTNMPRHHAMDNNSSDVILAYEQNREPLLPDHGFPLRLIVPGWIGGRNVKWLRKIEVTAKESGNYYHFFDNRVLPTSADVEEADTEGLWYKPECASYVMPINAVTSSPAHKEELPLCSFGEGKTSYHVKGFAYTGGGRKVIRVEVTLDSGDSWHQCQLTHPETPTLHGRWWCWCFWCVSVDVADLVADREIAFRARNESMNTQPEHIIWNLLGEMNNCWYRVHINPVLSKQGLALGFLHPTVAGSETGGWMDKNSKPKPKGSPTSEVGQEPDAKALRKIPMSEVEQHKLEDSTWIVVNGAVFNVTAFLSEHPEGVDAIEMNAGSDATDEFMPIHSDYAKRLLGKYLMGRLAKEEKGEGQADKEKAVPEALHTPPRAEAGEGKGEEAVPRALDPRKWLSCPLMNRTPVSWNVRRFRFALPSHRHSLGLPVGHLLLSVPMEGRQVARPYTPVSPLGARGHFDLVVKVYFRGVDPKHPQGGILSQLLEGLSPGDRVGVRGPMAHIRYGHGERVTMGRRELGLRCMGMVAGGTGITPIFQIIQAVLVGPGDITEMWLVYTNHSKGDILLRKELDEWAKDHPSQFHVWYAIAEKAPPDWEFSTVNVSQEMFQQHLPPPGNDTGIFLCGPPGMIEHGCMPNLVALGHDRSMVFAC